MTYTDFPLDRAIVLRLKGLSLRAIGEELGCSKFLAMKRLERAGMPQRTGARLGRFFPLEEAKRLYAEGLSQRRIAKRLCYTKASVGRHLRDAGFPMRSRGGDMRQWRHAA